MAVQALLLLLGLVLLLSGGDALVRGASALARRLGVSPLVIGLTVVAFGTSAPELAVSVSAAASGNGGIAFGNVIGSNVFNTAMLLGLTALVTPLRIDSGIVTREVPMLLLASAATAVASVDAFLDGGTSVLSRSDGLVLLLLFCVFLYYTAIGVLARRRDPLVEEAADEAPAPLAGGASWVAGLLLLYGLAALAFGGNLLVDAASEIARALGVAEVVIGNTVVAVGTNMPELATCLLAARRHEDDIAVGNAVGSSIFNLLFVLGMAATVRPVAVPQGSAIDLAVMLALALALIPIVTTDRRITRAEGSLLGVAYLGFLAWQLLRP